jgi:hypothetical protein
MKTTCPFFAHLTIVTLVTTVAPGLLAAADLVHAKDGSGGPAVVRISRA